jgi:radical SAM protein with 4Fe4S-binding SPASM domain
MEETVRTPGKSMDYDYFMQEMLPRVKNASVINFMGGEPTLHPRFPEIFSATLESMPRFSNLGIFTNGLMPEKTLELLEETIGRHGSISRNVTFSVLLNWQTSENITGKNHQRCGEVARRLLRRNGYGVTFSINLYSKDQDIETQCREIDAVYQEIGLPKDKDYRIRVSPAFPIVGDIHNVYLPIRDYPRLGRKMFDLLKQYPQMGFRFDCSFPPCFLDDIREDEYGLVPRFYYHGFKQVPELTEWKNNQIYFGCADGSPMDLDSKGDCFNCFPFHDLKLGNISEFKEVNPIATARMGSRFLNHVFEKTQAKEPCKSCPHYMVRCSSGCFAYNFVDEVGNPATEPAAAPLEKS